MSMSLQEFISKYDGVPNTGNTEANKGQCTGLVMVYIKEVLGLGHIWGHAKDIFYNAPSDEWNKVENSPEAYPKSGDVICWGSSWGGGYGHIGIVESSSPATDSFMSFEQNYPTGSPPKLINRTSWRGVIGWLSPKSSSDCEERLSIMTTNRNEWKQKADKFEIQIEEERQAHGKEVASKQKIIDDQQKLISEMQSKAISDAKAYMDIEKERTQYREACTKLDGILKTKEGEWEINRLELDAKLADSEIRRKRAEKKINELTFWEFLKIKLGRG